MNQEKLSDLPNPTKGCRRIMSHSHYLIMIWHILLQWALFVIDIPVAANLYGESERDRRMTFVSKFPGVKKTFAAKRFEILGNINQFQFHVMRTDEKSKLECKTFYPILFLYNNSSISDTLTYTRYQSFPRQWWMICVHNLFRITPGVSSCEPYW